MRNHLGRLTVKLAIDDQSVKVPRLEPLALGTGEKLQGAVAVEDGVAVSALAAALQIEWVNRPLVVAEFTDEAAPTAYEAAVDMLETESDGGCEAGQQLARPQLLQVLHAVPVRLSVEIVARPHSLGQIHLHPLAGGAAAGGEVGGQVGQLLPQPVRRVQLRRYAAQTGGEAANVYEGLGGDRAEEGEGSSGHGAGRPVPVVQQAGGDCGRVPGVAVGAIVPACVAAQPSRSKYFAHRLAAVLALPVLPGQPNLPGHQVQAARQPDVISEGESRHAHHHWLREPEAGVAPGRRAGLLRDEVGAGAGRTGQSRRGQNQSRPGRPVPAHRTGRDEQKLCKCVIPYHGYHGYHGYWHLYWTIKLRSGPNICSRVVRVRLKFRIAEPGLLVEKLKTVSLDWTS